MSRYELFVSAFSISYIMKEYRIFDYRLFKQADILVGILMDYKIVFFDIDGTITHHNDGCISSKTQYRSIL